MAGEGASEWPRRTTEAEEEAELRGTQQMDFGGNECTHTQKDRGGDGASADDERGPGADGCQLILCGESSKTENLVA